VKKMHPSAINSKGKQHSELQIHQGKNLIACLRAFSILAPSVVGPNMRRVTAAISAAAAAAAAEVANLAVAVAAVFFLFFFFFFQYADGTVDVLTVAAVVATDAGIVADAKTLAPLLVVCVSWRSTTATELTKHRPLLAKTSHTFLAKLPFDRAFWTV